MKGKLKVDDGTYERHNQFSLNTPIEINGESEISHKISNISKGWCRGAMNNKGLVSLVVDVVYKPMYTMVSL